MLIKVEKMTAFAEAIVTHGGGSAEEAATVCDHLVNANLAGHDSHGVGMLPAYMKGVKTGKLTPGNRGKIIKDTGVILVIDGQQGFGQVVAKETTEMGIERAKKHGIAAIGLRNAFHIGRIGTYGEMCADAGLISIHYVNALTPNSIVAPFGGSDSRYTTNPYCTAIPATASTPRTILDMATSNIAHGKARVAYLKGVDVPPNSIIDHEGNPTNDPSVLFNEPQGALTSMGAHKGYGLALICDLLGGALTGGGAYNRDLLVDGKVVNNMLTIILDPDLFDQEEFFLSEVDRYTKWVKASPPAPGFEEVMFPGDPERKSRADRLENGLPIDDGTWEQLLETAELVGLSRDEVMRIIGN
jgi:uncharacterized oxidoreductase